MFLTAQDEMECYKRCWNYTPPLAAVCEPHFVKYIKDTHPGKSVAAVLKELLGDQVHIYTTLCISLAIKGLFGVPGHLREAEMMGCDHTYEDPDFGGLTCFKSFVRNYDSPKLVVCTMTDADARLYYKYGGRMVLKPKSDLRGGITMFSNAQIFRQCPPPEIKIMNDYKRLFGYTAPFSTICEPEFLKYLRKSGKSETSVLEDLLGGRVNLISTPCINRVICAKDGYWDATVKDCGHTAAEFTGACCMKEFVKNHPSRQLVVCTMAARDHYARVPGIVVVTPDVRDGFVIATDPIETIIQLVKWTLTVKNLHLNVFKRLRKEILAQKSGTSSVHIGTEEPPMNLVVAAKNGEGADKAYFSSPEAAAKRILDISSSAMKPTTASGAMDIDDTKDVSLTLHLSTSVHEGDGYQVKIVVEKPDENVKESNESAKVKKPGYDMVDVSLRRPVIDVVENIGVGVTAEAQSLSDGLSKTCVDKKGKRKRHVEECDKPAEGMKPDVSKRKPKKKKNK